MEEEDDDFYGGGVSNAHDTENGYAKQSDPEAKMEISDEEDEDDADDSDDVRAPR